MNKYTFYHNGKKTNEVIIMTYENEEDFYIQTIDNIYSLVDYVNYNISNNSIVEFNNFKGNQLAFIYNSIIRYKEIKKLESYNACSISNKKRIKR